MTQEQFDIEYAAGAWDRLNESRQVGHYAVQAGLALHYKRADKVLEVGCGEGILSDYLPGSWYHGVDYSVEAIQLAMHRRPLHYFEVGDIRTWFPNEKFSCIFFNEVLYYFEDPIRVMEKVACWLAPNGILVTSQYGKKLEAPGFKLLQSFDVYHHGGTWWHVAAWEKQ